MMSAALIEQCVRASAELHGCDPLELMARTRGRREVARARVVAMCACRELGLPLRVIARAFRRTRFCVHQALRVGIPGRERRDMSVRASVREVLWEVEKLAYLARN